MKSNHVSMIRAQIVMVLVKVFWDHVFIILLVFVQNVAPDNKMVYTDKQYLVADTVEELHEFAVNTVKLKKRWFQNFINFPHYDIYGGKLLWALKCGVNVVTPEELREIAKKTKI